MATILKFEPRPAIGRSANDAGVIHAAEVVIFPGIRIERTEFRLSDRLTGPQPDKPDQRRRSRRTTRK